MLCLLQKGQSKPFWSAQVSTLLGGEGRGRGKEEQMKKGLEFCGIHGPGEGSDLFAT